MSTTSDSDDEVEARKALLQQFRARKHAQAKDAAQPAELSPAAADEGEPPLCVQIGWPRDYVFYTGLWADCRRRGWDVVGTDRRPMPDPAAGAGDGDAAEAERRQGGQPDAACWVPNVQFVPYKKTAWAALMTGQVLANHYYMRSGIIRKAELATTLLPHLRACHPETHVAELVDDAAREAFAGLVRRLVEEGGGLWLLKAGDSSNATDMHLVNGDDSRLAAIASVLGSTCRASWLVQRYIERPLQVRGFKFHIRATVLAVGRLKVYLHRHAIVLLASRPYQDAAGGLADLSDLGAHASNHSLAVSVNPDAEPEALLLADLAAALDAPPPIVDLAAFDPPSAPAAVLGQDHHGEPPVDGTRTGPGAVGGGEDGGRGWGAVADEELGGAWAAAVWRQLREVTWRVFHSAQHCEQPARVFRAVPCSFEMFGLDAMLDTDGRLWLLELNCDPDLKVFDTRFQHTAQEIMRDTVDAAVCTTLGVGAAAAEVGEGGDVGHAGGPRQKIGGYHLVLDESDRPDRFFDAHAPEA